MFFVVLFMILGQCGEGLGVICILPMTCFLRR